MKLRFLGSVLIFAVVAASQAQYVSYQAPGSSFLPTSVGSNLTASALNTTNSSANLEVGEGTGVQNTVFLRNTFFSPTAASAVANNQFFQFTLQANPGFDLDLGMFSFNARGGGLSSPRGWVLRSSFDGFSTNLGTGNVSAVPSFTHFDVDLNPFSMNNITGPITFRLYGFTPSQNSGIFFDNIQVFQGGDAPVPEPFTMALMGLGAAAVLRRKLRKS